MAHGLYPAAIAVASSAKKTLYFTYFPFAMCRKAEGQSNLPYIFNFLCPPNVPLFSERYSLPLLSVSLYSLFSLITHLNCWHIAVKNYDIIIRIIC